MELYTRTVGALPLSIGTSIALESIFMRANPAYDPDRKIPQKVNLQEYSEIWFNLSSLIRNIAGSVTRETYFDCAPSHIREILLTEIEIIQSIFMQEGHGVCKPVFYFCDYKSLAAECKRKGGKLRENTTLIQKSYETKLNLVLKQISSETDQIRHFDSELRPDHYGNALILTHIPYDLISQNKFKRLALLESHTGVLKTPVQWNTKYAPFGKESMDHLPFHKSLLLIFGDRNQIEPVDRRIRQRVYEISVKSKWTPLTKMEKVHDSFREHVMHPADLSLLLSF